MFMRTTDYTGSGRRDISHCRVDLLRQLIVAKQFSQPTALVRELAHLADYNVSYFAGVKISRHSPWLLLHYSTPDCWRLSSTPDWKRAASSQKYRHPSTSPRVHPMSFHFVRCTRC